MEPSGSHQTPVSEQRQDLERELRRLAGAEPADARVRQAADSGQRYEDFLRSAVDWLWEADASLTLTYASSPVALNLGIPAQVLIGRHLLGLGRFEANGGREQQAQSAMAERRPFRKAVFVMTGVNKREIAYHLSGVPIFDGRTGGFAGYRGTATAAPRAEARQDTAEEDLRVLARVLEETLMERQDLAWRLSQRDVEGEAETATLARTAHELRTPLNAVIGYADLALKEVFGELGDRYQDCFRTIREAGHHMDELISQLQGPARAAGQEALAAEAVDMTSVVAKAKAIVALAAKTAEVDIGRVGPLAGGQVVGDQLACAQILVNLLNNAIKFTPAGGSVGVETLAGPENKLHIVVWDTGIGISAEDQVKIFEPAYRVGSGSLGREAPGLGLGLSISRDLARAMGGDITVSSAPDSGSRFTLSLPLAAETRPAGTPGGPA